MSILRFCGGILMRYLGGILIRYCEGILRHCGDILRTEEIIYSEVLMRYSDEVSWRHSNEIL